MVKGESLKLKGQNMLLIGNGDASGPGYPLQILARANAQSLRGLWVLRCYPYRKIGQ